MVSERQAEILAHIGRLRRERDTLNERRMQIIEQIDDLLSEYDALEFEAQYERDGGDLSEFEAHLGVYDPESE